MDEPETISKRTWNRNIVAVNKAGFMDGASDGQKSVFQSSFDLGYKQGLIFGFELGITKATSMQEQINNNESKLGDPRNINCQACLDISLLQENVENIDHKQQGKNIQVLSTLND